MPALQQKSPKHGLKTRRYRAATRAGAARLHAAKSTIPAEKGRSSAAPLQGEGSRIGACTGVPLALARKSNAIL